MSDCRICGGELIKVGRLRLCRSCSSAFTAIAGPPEAWDASRGDIVRGTIEAWDRQAARFEAVDDENTALRRVARAYVSRLEADYPESYWGEDYHQAVAILSRSPAAGQPTRLEAFTAVLRDIRELAQSDQSDLTIACTVGAWANDALAAGQTEPAADIHEYEGACRNTQHLGCTCRHPVNGRWCGQDRRAAIHQVQPAAALGARRGGVMVDRCLDCGHVLSICEHAMSRMIEPTLSFLLGQEEERASAWAAANARIAELEAQVEAEVEHHESAMDLVRAHVATSLAAANARIAALEQALDIAATLSEDGEALARNIDNSVHRAQIDALTAQNAALVAALEIVMPMAERGAEGGGSRGPEMRDLEEARALISRLPAAGGKAT